MSENTEKKIGTKRIMDVPIIEELGENSYVLVDNDGAAARIPGSKVGGGGGELPVLYVSAQDYGGDAPTPMYIDKNCSIQADFETGIETLAKHPVFCVVEDGTVSAVIALLVIQFIRGGKLVAGLDGYSREGAFAFSDSILD
jgi:hypothetical protein